jgi:hypothetical protein
VLAMLMGLTIPAIGAESTTAIDFLNPLGTIEPLANQPLTDRPNGLADKTIKLLYYGAANTPSQLTCVALGDLLVQRYIELDISIINGGPNSLGTVMYDAKTDAQYDAWAADADAIILGVLEDNVGSWWISYHAKQLEARGVPVVVVANSWFESAVLCGAQDNGFAAMRTVFIDRSKYADAYGKATTGTPSARATYIGSLLVDEGIIDAVDYALTAPLTDAEQSCTPLEAAVLGDPGVDFFTTYGSSYENAMQNFQTLSLDLDIGDGLPLTIPTRQLVNQLLATTDRDPDEVLGKMMPRAGVITVEKVAINAVMAGARPEHFPVILAAVEAYANAWEDDKLFYQALMSNEQNNIVIMVSGPIAKELAFGSGRVFASPFDEADGIIGRAFKLCVRNIGHMLQKNSTAIAGLGRYNDHEMFVFGEDQDMTKYNGWETFSEHMGFGDDANTVTLCYTSYTRFNGGAGGSVMTGGLPAGAITSIRTAVGTAATAVPSIITINDSISQMMSSTNNAAWTTGGFGTSAMSWTDKDTLQRGLSAATPNDNIRYAFWPVVAGEACTAGKVFNGGAAIGLRGFQTQLIADKADDPVAPSAPLDFDVELSADGTVATLSWDVPDRGVVVMYQVSKDDGRTWYDLSADARSWVCEDLEIGAQYFFRVRAVSNIKNSADIAGVANSATDPLYVSFKASGRGAWAGASIFAIPDETDEVVGETVTVTIERGQGNVSFLTISIKMTYASGRDETISETFEINGSNVSDTYQVGPYRVYVRIQGSATIAEYYIVYDVMMMSFEDEIAEEELIAEEPIAVSFDELVDEGAGDGGFEDAGEAIE